MKKFIEFIEVCDECKKYGVFHYDIFEHEDSPSGKVSTDVIFAEIKETNEIIVDLRFGSEDVVEMGRAIHYYHKGFSNGKKWGLWSGKIQMKQAFAKLMDLEMVKPF